jgi:hypothetical protein
MKRGVLYRTKEDADKGAVLGRVACIPVTYEYEVPDE